METEKLAKQIESERVVYERSLAAVRLAADGIHMANFVGKLPDKLLGHVAAKVASRARGLRDVTSAVARVLLDSEIVERGIGSYELAGDGNRYLKVDVNKLADAWMTS